MGPTKKGLLAGKVELACVCHWGGKIIFRYVHEHQAFIYSPPHSTSVLLLPHGRRRRGRERRTEVDRAGDGPRAAAWHREIHPEPPPRRCSRR